MKRISFISIFIYLIHWINFTADKMGQLSIFTLKLRSVKFTERKMWWNSFWNNNKKCNVLEPSINTFSLCFAITRRSGHLQLPSTHFQWCANKLSNGKCVGPSRLFCNDSASIASWRHFNLENNWISLVSLRVTPCLTLSHNLSHTIYRFHFHFKFQ